MDKPSIRNALKFTIFIFFVALSIYFGSLWSVDIHRLQGYFKEFSLFNSGVVFVLLYCVVTFFFIFSRDIFKVLGVVLFGPYLSSMLIWVAEIANAAITFKLSRFLGQDFIRNAIESKKRGAHARLAGVSFLWLFFMRATPLVPFRFLDLTCGLTGIPFKRYLLAVIFGSPVRILWVQYILSFAGMAAFNPSKLAGYLLNNKPVFIFSLLYVILVIFAALKLRVKANEGKV